MRLYKTLVRPILDLASSGYRVYEQLLEGVQNRATKAAAKMRDKVYDEHLKELKSSTLVH